MSVSPVVIVASQLHKSFNGLEAVKDMSFQIRRGECYGFLGPNGAGKTTTMRMIYCFSSPSSGELRVLDYDVTQNARGIKARLGVVPQEENLDPDLSVFQNLLLFATYFDIPKKEAARRAEELLDFLSLQEKRDQKIERLSGGMKRRLLIARALINEPEVLILDEPTTGLDPQARHLIWHKLRMLKSSGVTMVLTTHYMEEAQRLCDRLNIMDRGRMLAEGQPDRLVEQYAGREVLEVRAEQPVLEGLRDRILQDGRVPFSGDRSRMVELVGDTLYTRLLERDFKILDLYPEVQQLDFRLRPATLEDVFLNLTGRELRD
jgi:lipooligosaccharide transport system ATP-binding protein